MQGVFFCLMKKGCLYTKVGSWFYRLCQVYLWWLLYILLCFFLLSSIFSQYHHINFLSLLYFLYSLSPVYSIPALYIVNNWKTFYDLAIFYSLWIAVYSLLSILCSFYVTLFSYLSFRVIPSILSIYNLFHISTL